MASPSGGRKLALLPRRSSARGGKTGVQKRGKVQEGGTSSCRATGERGPGGIRVQGETKAGSPCAIFGGAINEAAGSPPRWEMTLGRFLGFCFGVGRGFR
jgi:hypothetical protein